jgi:hypothetical protein
LKVSRKAKTRGTVTPECGYFALKILTNYAEIPVSRAESLLSSFTAIRVSQHLQQTRARGGSLSQKIHGLSHGNIEQIQTKI